MKTKEDILLKHCDGTELGRHPSDDTYCEIGGAIDGKTELVLADQYFPSSKKCSSCGTIKEKLSLKERTYNCGTCGLSLDRDLNAAKNLAVYSPTAKYAESHASGGRSSSSEMTKSLPMNEGVILNHNLNLQT